MTDDRWEQDDRCTQTHASQRGVCVHAITLAVLGGQRTQKQQGIDQQEKVGCFQISLLAFLAFLKYIDHLKKSKTHKKLVTFQGFAEGRWRANQPGQVKPNEWRPDLQKMAGAEPGGDWLTSKGALTELLSRLFPIEREKVGRHWKYETEKGGHAKMEHGTVFNLLLRLRSLHGRVTNRPAHFCYFFTQQKKSAR